MTDTAGEAAHHVELRVAPSDIDAYDHVNNSVYLTWMDAAAWSHSAALGVPVEDCQTLRRGMAAQRIEIDYLRAAVAGDRVRVGTWISASDGRLRVERRFHLTRLPDGAVLARARVQYVCINLDTGGAARMPPRFVQAYRA
ncbi:MAG: acyl-CoA thioesterase [Proteobacteria bacterium]|nr:acyl-CoA thioesterase [Pseudomonadota bacterium]